MAYNNIDNLNLGNLLQIVFTDSVRNQISVDFRDFEMIKRAKAGSSVARELRFMFQTTLGAAAIQYRDPGTSGRAFPAAQQVSISEKTAKFKEMNATIELEYNLWDRARKSPEKYAEPLALEIQSKASAAKRRLAADLYGDGTGVIGQLPASAGTVSNGMIEWQLATTNTARGHVGFFEYGDLLILRDPDTTATALDTDLATEPAYWKVVERYRDTDKVLLQGLDANLAPVTITSITTQPAAGAVFYRIGQPTIPDLSSSITDYGTVTEVIAGLESLTAADGRTIHGITMTGATSGTRVDCGANPIDVKYFQKALSQVKVRVGADRYSWKAALMAPETYDALVESREADRRFTSLDDTIRGGKKFGYQHQNDFVEFIVSEFVPKKRIYLIPEAKAGEKVLEFHGSDFETVKVQGGSDFHLKATSNGYVNSMQSFLQAIGVIICKHPAAVAVVHNFTVA